MATIIQIPDSLSFSANLKKIIASSASDISVLLKMGDREIFDLIYSPGIGGIIEVDLWRIVDKLLTTGIPTNDNILTEQTLGIADFTVSVDSQVIAFRAIKGGVLEIQSQAHDFVDSHLLTWQPQEKKILQYAPEWLGIYTTAQRRIKVKAYFIDQSTETISLATAAEDKLYAVNVSWAAVNGALTKKNPVAWDVWTEDISGTRLSFIQRYILRNASDEENLYLWCNTLGGIDSFSMTGYLQDDEKLEHKISELIDETLDEYDINKRREIHQSTGFITLEESRWLKDFFLSPIRYQVKKDGAIKRIVVVESKILSSTADDQHEYEFTYRYADDPSLINLDKTLDPLPAPEVPGDFFLTELLSGLTTAQYADNLYLAVQSPFAQGWQKLSFAQLWEMAMPTLVDNDTILFFDGKLRTNAGVIIEGRKPKHGFEAAADAVLSFRNQTREFTISAPLNEEVIRVWNWGKLLEKVTESISLDNTIGTWHIYYKDALQSDNTKLSVLTATINSWDRKQDIPLAKIFWDGSEGKVIDFRYVYTEVNHSPLTRFEDKPHPAEDIYNDTSKFANLFTPAENTIQKVIDRLDYLLKVQVVEFVNKSEPSLENYQVDYFPRHDKNPNVRLVLYENNDPNGNELPLFQAPIIEKVNGHITRIAYNLGGELFTGKILISRL